MKYYLLILLVTFTVPAYANSIVIMGYTKEDIQFEYLAGGPEQIRSTINILVNLSNRLIEARQYKQKVHIYFEHDYTKRDTACYALGYGTFEVDEGERKKTEGLEIFIRDRDLDISRVLSLIDFGCSNMFYVKVGQYRQIVDSYNSRMDTLKSIPLEEVKKHFTSSDPVLLRLLNEKTFDLKDEQPWYCPDYYYQDNKFHFYDTRNPRKTWSASENRYVINDIFGKDILIVDDVFEICGNDRDGQLVFINDSVFHYIDNREGIAKGPYKIDNVRNGRPSIRNYYYDYKSSRFTLFIGDYDTERKVAFFPDRNRVIQDYEKAENVFINGLFRNKKSVITNTKTHTGKIILWIVSGLSILLNIWLLFKPRTKNTFFAVLPYCIFTILF